MANSPSLRVQLQVLVEGLTRLREGIDGIHGFRDAALGMGATLPEVSTSLGGLSSSFGKLEKMVGLAMKGFIAFAGLKGLKDMADVAAKNETLAVVLETVGFNAGYSTEELTKYEKAMKKQGITTSVARDTMVQFMKSGIELGDVAGNGTSNIEALAAAAQNLAVVSGGSSSEALQQMIVNIQQMDTVGLRHIGVEVSMEAAMEAYAQSVNKAAGALTEGEKKQAVINAILKEGGAIAGVYAKSMETVGKQLGSMQRLQEEAAASIGSMLTPAYTEVVKLASDFLVVVQEGAEKMREQGAAAEVLQSIAKTIADLARSVGAVIADNLGTLWAALGPTIAKLQAAFSDLSLGDAFAPLKDLLAVVVRGFSSLITVVGDNAALIKTLWTSVRSLFDALGSVIGAVASLSGGFQSAEMQGGLLKIVILAVGAALALIADAARMVADTLRIGFGLSTEIVGYFLQSVGKLVSYLDKDMGDAITKWAEGITEAGRVTREAGQTSVNAFAKGDTAVNKFRTSVMNAADAPPKLAKSLEQVAKEAEALGLMSGKVRAFNEEVRKGTLTGAAAQARYEALTEELKDMSLSYGLSAKDTKALTAALNSNKDKALDVSAQYKVLGLSARELSTGMSDVGGQAATAFDKIAAGGLKASDTLKLLDKGLSMETSIQGVSRFQASLEGLYKKGLIDQKTFEQGQSAVRAKFFELTDAALKAAKTSEDFARLSQEIRNSGMDAGAMRVALEKVAVAARNAAKDSLQAAQNSRDLAASETAVLRAKGDVKRSLIEVDKAHRSVMLAQMEVTKEDTSLNRAKLKLAQDQAALAQAMVAASQAALQKETASQAVLIAQQKEMLALKKATLNPGDSKLQESVDLATKLVSKRQEELAIADKAVQKAGQQVEVQKQQVDKSTAAVSAEQDKLKAVGNVTGAKQTSLGYSDRLLQREKEMAEASKENSAAASEMAGFLAAAITPLLNTEHTLRGMGGLLDYSKESAEGVLRAMRAGAGTMTGYIEVLAGATKLYNRHIEQLKEQNAEADDLAARFAAAKDEAAAIVDAASGIPRPLTEGHVISEKLANTMASVRREARGTIKDIADSVRQFASSASSIREEFLNASGREDEALTMRYEARRKELAMEYKMLEVKVRAAEVTARAAGLSAEEVSNIRAMLLEASSAYSMALSDLEALEDLERAKLAKQKAADRESAKRDKDRPLPTVEEDSRTRTAYQPTTTAAPGATPAGIAPVAGMSGKTTVVKFELGGKSVPATVNASDETSLLDIISRARSVA